MLEQLEHRRLLTISVADTATWVEQGPGPIIDAPSVSGMDAQQNPAAGAINGITTDPNNADIVYVASVNGGVWKTTDATNLNPTWTPLTDGMPSLSTSCIAISPLDPNTLYAGTSFNLSHYSLHEGPVIGLLKTTDGGNTWNVVGSSTLANRQIVSVVPTALTTPQGQVVLVGTGVGDGGGVFRSSDGGSTFVRISGGAATDLPAAAVSQVIADPGDSSRFYAGVPGYGVYRSTDGGETWSPTDSGISGLAGSTGIELAVYNNTGTGGNVVYAAVGGDYSPVTGFYRSSDEGNTWTAMDLPNASYLLTNMVADPTDANVVYIGAYDGNGFGGLRRGEASLPLGSQWTSNEGADTANTSPHSDSRDMIFDANGNLLEADDGGIYRLVNPDNSATRKWQPVIGNLRVTEMYWASYDSLNHAVFAGTQDDANPVQETPGSFTWKNAGGGDGGITQVDTTSMPGYSLHYFSSQDLGGFTRNTYDNANALVNSQSVKLVVNGTGGQNLYNLQQSGAISLSGIVPYVLNAVDPNAHRHRHGSLKGD